MIQIVCNGLHSKCASYVVAYYTWEKMTMFNHGIMGCQMQNSEPSEKCIVSTRGYGSTFGSFVCIKATHVFHGKTCPCQMVTRHIPRTPSFFPLDAWYNSAPLEPLEPPFTIALSWFIQWHGHGNESYNWLFQWDYTCYKWGFLSTYNWYFGPEL